MGLKIGIVGLPNVGKSTLFNALLKKRVALSANYPFATIEPNVGVVTVPDPRLDKLAQLVKSEEGMTELPPIVPAAIEFVDIAGLVKGASEGAGLGNKFLSHIREVDAIIHVLRDFSDTNIIREGSVDPKSDKEIIETELALADIETVGKLAFNQDKEFKASGDPLEKTKLETLQLIKADLEKGKIGDYQFNDERISEWFSKLPLLSIKPVLFVYNVGEEEYGGPHFAEASRGKDNELMICAKLEEDLADYTEEERKEYLQSMGIEKTGLERLIVKAYDLLGLMSFLTAGKKEVKAWTIKKGTKAPQAAGVIHTDFEKGFIRAECVDYDKLIEVGSIPKAKEKGYLRTEGKNYEMKDGDVVEFLISS